MTCGCHLFTLVAQTTEWTPACQVSLTAVTSLTAVSSLFFCQLQRKGQVGTGGDGREQENSWFVNFMVGFAIQHELQRRSLISIHCRKEESQGKPNRAYSSKGNAKRKRPSSRGSHYSFLTLYGLFVSGVILSILHYKTSIRTANHVESTDGFCFLADRSQQKRHQFFSGNTKTIP